LTHNNTKIIAASCQGYHKKLDCIKNADRVVMMGRTHDG